MRFVKLILSIAAVAVAMAVTAGPAAAQTKLKWAHVYETSEPFHTWSVWAAQEIEKRTNGRYHIDVFPASSLGKESDINQGLTLGTVDMIISGLSFAARTFPRIGVGYYPYTFRDGEHLIKWSCPREVEFRSALPQTRVGKVDYRALVEEHLARQRRDTSG